MRGLSLFSGLGAFDVALAPWVDFELGCDCDPFVAGLYERRFGRPVLPDVREVDAGLGRFDVVTAGFPRGDNLRSRVAATEGGLWPTPRGSTTREAA